MPQWCAKQSMMIGFGFESESFSDALKLFKHMEVVEAICEVVGQPSQNKQYRAYANRDSGWKTNRGESALPTGSANIRDGKRGGLL